MSDLIAGVRDVLPSVRADLEDLVRIESVWADPARRGETLTIADFVRLYQRSADSVASDEPSDGTSRPAQVF